MKPEYVSGIGNALWNGWGEMESVLDITCEDRKVAFKKYIGKYYLTIDTVCEKSLRKELSMPPYSPDAVCTPEEKVARERILVKASVFENKHAEIKMKNAYINYRNSKTDLQQGHLREEPPLKFATQEYDASLANTVAESKRREEQHIFSQSSQNTRGDHYQASNSVEQPSEERKSARHADFCDHSMMLLSPTQAFRPLHEAPASPPQANHFSGSSRSLYCYKQRHCCSCRGEIFVKS